MMVESQPFCELSVVMYVSLIEALPPPGKLNDCPEQIWTFWLITMSFRTVKVVVIVESHPADDWIVIG